MFEAIAFYLFAFLTITMFYITVTTSQALYALTALAAGMIFISAFFFILGADFLGAVQIVVYSGAVMALYAFGMMFFDTTREVKEKIHSYGFSYNFCSFNGCDIRCSNPWR
jgi:NADH-quinone oxidoreductase subunit J